jgi:hypothetical protein
MTNRSLTTRADWRSPTKGGQLLDGERLFMSPSMTLDDRRTAAGDRWRLSASLLGLLSSGLLGKPP